MVYNSGSGLATYSLHNNAFKFRHVYACKRGHILQHWCWYAWVTFSWIGRRRLQRAVDRGTLNGVNARSAHIVRYFNSSIVSSDQIFKITCHHRHATRACCTTEYGPKWLSLITSRSLSNGVACTINLHADIDSIHTILHDVTLTMRIDVPPVANDAARKLDLSIVINILPDWHKNQIHKFK